MGLCIMVDGFHSISEIINNEPGLEKIRRIIKQHDVTVNFHKIFPDLKMIAKPIKVEKKVLHLKVSNSIWRSELKFNQSTIIEKINSFYGDEIIKNIKFQ